MSNPIQEFKIQEWVLKVREPKNPEKCEVIFLLHGWTGDENSMWVFESQIPDDFFVITLRGLFPTTQPDLGGYSWVQKTVDFWPTYQDFLPAVYKFVALIKNLKELFPWANFEKISLVGFSQGAAMAVSIAVEFPSFIKKLAVLAGFLPDQIYKKLPAGNELSVFIGHGEKDKIVPLVKAVETKNYFESMVAQVIYCTAPVEHRLGRECAMGLKDFLKS